MSEHTAAARVDPVSTPEDAPEVMDPMADQTELVFRQVPSGHIKCGRLTSQAFAPMPKDGRLLSVDRSSMVTAEQAFRAFVARGRSSEGSWAVTVGECSSYELPCFWNPRPKLADGTREDNEAHSVIDYRTVSTDSQIKKKATCLGSIAQRRGCQYPIHGTNDNGNASSDGSGSGFSSQLLGVEWPEK